LALGESVELADGEEFTNEILLGRAGGFGAILGAEHQMCPNGADFKHYQPAEGSDSQHSCNVSSIICAKVLSIMVGGEVGLTSLFKRFPKRAR
jgi:hypothetical protein